MIVDTSLASTPSSPIPAHDPGSDDQNGSDLPQSLPCWATQAQSDLSQAEAELRCLQERHAMETESVKKGVERAISGVRREERRLLERVEQDHRDAQQRLEQVQRENLAAARVSQSLLDQRLCKLALLQQQIQQSGLDESESNHNLLLKEVAEFLQPWEISVSLKKVNFKPSSQTKAVTFGDIRVQDQNLCLHAGGCGPHGQMCALHTQEMQNRITGPQGTGDANINQEQGWTSPTGRVIRKISLSTWCDPKAEEEPTTSSPEIHHWPTKFEQSGWESLRGDDQEFSPMEPHADQAFLSVPTILRNKDTESRELGRRMNFNGNQYSPKNPRKPLSVISRQSLSPSPERRKEHPKLSHCLSLDSQSGDKGHMDNGRPLRYGSRPSPRMTTASKSCQDLSSRVRPHSCLSQSSDEHSLGTFGDSGRAPSPADSLDSSYTFIVGPSHDDSMNRGPLNYNCHLSKSAVDLTNKTGPFVSSGRNESVGVWRVQCSNFNSMASSMLPSPTLRRRQKVSDRGQAVSYPYPVSRSLSMSVIDGSSQEPERGRRERGAPPLVELEEGNSSLRVFNPTGVHLIRQFGKQGSGRSDLTLPSGVHCTPQGQLFIVDCGNARVQVTDLRGNVLQQVTSPNSDDSARRSRNYFDIAVNAKGLMALSCAAERALLVFNRHGRLLQTFGGSGLASAKDELEAPRGVTVTRRDEFVVADIRKGTLIALKLDHKTGSRVERTVVTGFHRPYLLAACLSSGMIAVSERGSETGRVPCIKVLEPGWNTVRVLGVCSGMGPVLVCPWGICIDDDGNVLVADWGETHRVLLYPPQGVGRPLVTQDLSSPRGLTLLPEGHLAVSDSMHHCIKIYQYKL